MTTGGSSGGLARLHPHPDTTGGPSRPSASGALAGGALGPAPAVPARPFFRLHAGAGARQAPRLSGAAGL
ncbi:hypothetical protein [Sphaerisporangium sp. TRM90804]|uniref:hypothetical protein n=1 Tax=Sphaerisporangium sp. TRM90804 TaxID=3031113 RepID=UPI00244907A9|nr:hypothetical protein [Sphaerisporangium sp. TRM90804]MDH2428554.1 hypothetical protein [Sphaerisporangium sp. TRM90804]